MPSKSQPKKPAASDYLRQTIQDLRSELALAQNQGDDTQAIETALAWKLHALAQHEEESSVQQAT
jgi:hypothetical protein